MSKLFTLEFRDEDLYIHWARLKKTWQETGDKVLGGRLNIQKQWLSQRHLVFDNAEEKSQRGNQWVQRAGQEERPIIKVLAIKQ